MGEDILRKSLIRLASFVASKDWSPATGGNFSARVKDFNNLMLITKSGLEKTSLTYNSFIKSTFSGEKVEDCADKLSAEALIHGLIYSISSANFVLHTHSVWNTLASTVEPSDIYLIENFEMLKALKGITTHLHRECVPIFENSQDMRELCETIRGRLETGNSVHGFLLRGHGLYTWGESEAEVKRHLEAFEFLFEVSVRMRGTK